MREMIFRERQDKVAHLNAITRVVAQLYGLDSTRVFGHIVQSYSQEIFQETYDADLLRKKLEDLQRAQMRVRTKRREDVKQISRLEKMGEYYDKVMGPMPFDKKKPPVPQAPRPLKKDPAK